MPRPSRDHSLLICGFPPARARIATNGTLRATDGKRFLIIHGDLGSAPGQLNVILNCFADLDHDARSSR